MSLFNVFNIAGSGMSAQTVRLNTTASNLSNAQTPAHSAEEAYKEKDPIFAAVAQQVNAQFQNAGAGVKVESIANSSAPALKEYNPGHPLADKEGYIYKPNINVVEQMANMISAGKSYEMNVQMLQTLKHLAQQTLEVGK